MLKNQNNDFSEIIIFLAITKLRLSAYPKAFALAQFDDSKPFSLSPAKNHSGC